MSYWVFRITYSRAYKKNAAALAIFRKWNSKPFPLVSNESNFTHWLGSLERNLTCFFFQQSAHREIFPSSATRTFCNNRNCIKEKCRKNRREMLFGTSWQSGKQMKKKMDGLFQMGFEMCRRVRNVTQRGRYVQKNSFIPINVTYPIIVHNYNSQFFSISTIFC